MSIHISCLPSVLERIVADYAWESYLSQESKKCQDSCMNELRTIADQLQFHSVWQQPRNIMILTAVLIRNPSLPGRTLDLWKRRRIVLLFA